MQDQIEYDAIVVGSGAAGGMAAYELVLGGFNVLMLEAGRDYDPVTETPMFQTTEEAPLRTEATSDKQTFRYYDATVGGGWTIDGEPYSSEDGSVFRWWRPRMLGGRTNHWDRVTLRFGPYDFKVKDRDGFGFNWPIGYDDLKPWYDYVERLIGVTGLAHGIENTPDSDPGIHLPPPPPRVFEIFLSRALESLGIRVAAMRAAILTKPHNGRPACFFATSCMRGCSIAANFQSTTVLLPPARATGRLTIRTDAVVHRVDVDDEGRATGVSFHDRTAGAEHSARAKFVVLGAGTCASVRILFNSANENCPSGLGNQHGLLGKYLMDSTGTAIIAHIPALEKIAPQNDDGMYVSHIYVPWWGHGMWERGEIDFPRGYQIEFQGGWRMPDMRVGNYPAYLDPAGQLFGEQLGEKVASMYGSIVIFGGEGEMIPNEDSFCTINPAQRDRWGVPTLKFSFKWGEFEKRQYDHMHMTFDKVIRKLGGTIKYKGPLLEGGEMIHEVGGARMGTSPENSCVNEFGQLWEADNLFLVDGSVFVSKPHKNPTLTIMALAARTAHHILERVDAKADQAEAGTEPTLEMGA